ncbi:unnamed protein product, partial [Adineta steineri]
GREIIFTTTGLLKSPLTCELLINKIWAYARLVFMPVSKDYTIRNIESGQTKCDSREEMSHEDFFLYVTHFIRFYL